VKVYTNIDDFRAKRSVVTVGTFDGVHLGHVKLLNKLQELKLQHNGCSVVVTFWPHPRTVVSPESHISLLNTLEEKAEILENYGVDHLIIIPFTRVFSMLSAKEFIEQYLVHKISAIQLVVGYDHRFGYDRIGDFFTLKQILEPHKIGLEKVEAYTMHNKTISSTKIRAALDDGNIELASNYLGYDYFISGIVVVGNQIGRTIGFPTANMQLKDSIKKLPQDGVYATNVFYKGHKFNGMLNIGVRPTLKFQKIMRTIEVNLFNFDEVIYGQMLTIVLKHRVRREKKFEGLAELKHQLHTDKQFILDMLEAGEL